MFKKLLNWLCVILWMGVIYYFSSLPDLKSELPTFWDTIFRKIAHISEFFVLSYFLFRALEEYKIHFISLWILTGVSSIFYASFDEYHQTFVYGRRGTIYDVFIDMLGVLFFLTLILFYKNH